MRKRAALVPFVDREVVIVEVEAAMLPPAGQWEVIGNMVVVEVELVSNEMLRGT